MSAFPFSAPIVTEEEDRAERAALSEEERRRYHDEVYGTEIEITETEEMIHNGLQLLESALESLTPESKQDYQNALKRVPELVESESPRISFLRGCKYDAWAAARRLVDYWSTRKKVFGEERAFLPMTLQGAMAEDVQYLEKALFLSLPDDAHHRAVIFIDRVRCTNNVIPRDSFIRCYWYFIQMCVENVTYQHRGFVAILNYRGYDLYRNFDRIILKKTVWIVNCMPVHVKATHLCTGFNSSVMRDLVLPVMRQMAGRDNRRRMQLHDGSTLEVLKQFQPFGLGEVHMQTVFAGEATNRLAVEIWLNQRRLIEDERIMRSSEEQSDTN